MQSAVQTPSQPMRRKVKYGKKIASMSEATSAIFPKEILSSERITQCIEPACVKSKSAARPEEAICSTRSKREALEDITELLSNVTITEQEQKPTKSHIVQTTELGSPRRSPRRHAGTPKVVDLVETLSNITFEQIEHAPKPTSPTKSVRKSKKAGSSRRRSKLVIENCQEPGKNKKIQTQHSWLKPLVGAYKRPDAPNDVISVHSWDTLIDPKWSLDKIAESSYAEVYKVSNNYGTSILKIMSLKPPKGPGSQRETSIPVEMVLSEVMIMNLMADLDGYVEFKEAHIIEGRPPVALQKAFNSYMDEHETFFPKPTAYHKDQLFLVLELGDAGTDVEHFEFVTPAQIWDLFLGVVVALASGEQAFGFEHRDLHEGNVCLRQTADPRPIPTTTRHRQGYSGLQITLLDYTLSRASAPDQTLHLDLESDPEIFASTSLLQHQMYRRMRNWIFFRTHGIHHPLFDSVNPPQCGSWADFEPYTNVIWLWYILTHVLEKYKGKGKREFLKETEELRAFLHPDVRVYDGGFGDVGAVYEYCMEKGWLE